MPDEIKLIIFLFLVIFGISLLAYGGKGEVEERTHYLSTMERGMYGASKLVKLAEKTEFNVVQHRGDFFDGVPQNTEVIFELCPEADFDPKEINAITNWVKDGGTFIFGSDIGSVIDLEIAGYDRRNFPIEGHILPYTEETELFTDDETRIYDTGNPENQIVMTPVLKAVDDPIFYNVDEIHVPLISFEEKLWRTNYIYKLNDPFNELLPFYRDEDEEADSENAIESPESDTSEDWETLAFDKGKPAIIGLTLDEGRIIAIANPLILSNGFIEAGDNVVFAYNLLSRDKKGGNVLFDEYRHGFTRSTLTPVSATGWGRTLYFLVFVGLLAIISKAVRFIPPRAVPPPQRRSQVEYLRSMAQIFRRARALDAVARIILRDLRTLPQDSPDVKRLKIDLETQVYSSSPSRQIIFESLKTLNNMEKSIMLRINKP